jgi:hypothetical protein
VIVFLIRLILRKKRSSFLSDCVKECAEANDFFGIFLNDTEGEGFRVGLIYYQILKA